MNNMFEELALALSPMKNKKQINKQRCNRMSENKLKMIELEQVCTFQSWLIA